MAYANNSDIYKVYVVVKKLRTPKAKKYLIESRLNISNVDVVKPGSEDVYLQMCLSHGKTPCINLVKVDPRAIPKDSYYIRVEDLSNYKAILLMQGLDITLP